MHISRAVQYRTHNVLGTHQRVARRDQNNIQLYCRPTIESRPVDGREIKERKGKERKEKR